MWSLAVVNVGFSAPSFTASEANGSVSVCMNIFGAVLARSVTVLLSTQDDTAFCEFVFVSKLLGYEQVTLSASKFLAESYMLHNLTCSIIYFMGSLTSGVVKSVSVQHKLVRVRNTDTEKAFVLYYLSLSIHSV